MITIDGSKGEGGGQVIRTSLALSMITGKSFEVQNVRGRRKNAGLARQHLTCVLAAKEICNAEVLGAQLKSSHIKFEPQAVVPGEYSFPIGTAGSTICRKADWSRKNSEVIVVEKPRGPGNVVLIRLKSDQVTEVFSGVGEVGNRAEQVARKVLKLARGYLGAEVPVGPHLADQLMLPAAIAATHGKESVYLTMPLTQHSQTHIDIIGRFLDVKIEATETSGSNVEVRIAP